MMGVLTTRAAVDSSLTLMTEVSPGKVNELSTRTARLYLV